MDATLEMLDDVEEELMARSFLFTHPVSYRDGVGATTEAVRTMLAKVRLAEVGARKPTEEAS